jgi:hypothetical protein
MTPAVLLLGFQALQFLYACGELANTDPYHQDMYNVRYHARLGSTEDTYVQGVTWPCLVLGVQPRNCYLIALAR